MRQEYKDYLLTKRVIVNDFDYPTKESFDDVALILTRLYNDFGIIITENENLVNRYVYGYIDSMIGGKSIAPSFYRNFPSSVIKMTSEELLIDQVTHYITTYGFGDFSTAGHSIFETEEIRPLLMEVGEIKRFRIVDVDEAYSILKQSCVDILSGTRPLNNDMYNLIMSVYEDIVIPFDSDVIPFEYTEVFTKVSSKDTAMRLLYDTRDPYFAHFITLSDFPKLVERVAAKNKQKINNLHLSNQDRKFISKSLDVLFVDEDSVKNNIRECCEKKKVWCGFLHHIHYKPKTSAASQFVEIMRGKDNLSVLSQTEKLINSGRPELAAGIMKAYKGSGYVLRNLNYLLSRCTSDDMIEKVFNSISNDCNPIIALQLFNEYSLKTDDQSARSFSFTKYGLTKTHRETQEEMKSRKSRVSDTVKKKASVILYDTIVSKYKGSLNGKVFIDESFSKIAPPMYESASSLGIGSLPTGSRIPLNGKNVRAFTYWEKVNDIDLACFGINKDGSRNEFSWRNMYGKQSDYITFSGDQTSGYNGGSEYFDIKLDKFKNEYPNTKYLVFTDNVFSGSPFTKCICKAGFMLRDSLTDGQVYEPKTVNTSYAITADSTMAYLFAIDLETEELVWLNLDMCSNSCVAGTTNMSFLDKYIYLANTITMHDIIVSSATELVDIPEDADVVFSDVIEGDNVVHSCDIDRLAALLNLNFTLPEKD